MLLILAPSHLHNVASFTPVTTTSSKSIIATHPFLAKSYPLAADVTAIDLPDGTILLIGQCEVPLIAHFLPMRTTPRPL